MSWTVHLQFQLRSSQNPVVPQGGRPCRPCHPDNGKLSADDRPLSEFSKSHVEKSSCSPSPKLELSLNSCLPLHRQQERLLKRLGDPAQEARRIGAVNQPMIVGKRERQNQPRLEPSADPFPLRTRT